MRVLVRFAAAGVALCVGVATLSACRSPENSPDNNAPRGSYRLVAFDSCEDALAGLREAGKQSVGPYGFAGSAWAADLAMGAGGEREMVGAVPPAQPNAVSDAAKEVGAQPGAGQGYSGTNTHEAGVDEPDLVKTDGRRIVTLSGGKLRVVDAASRTLTGTLDLSTNGLGATADDLLLSGDHALVLARYPLRLRGGPAGVADYPAAGRGVSDVAGLDPIREPGPVGPRLTLVSLSGQPRILSSVAVDGDLVDARQVASTARVVIRSAPRLQFPMPQPDQDTSEAQRTAVNHGIIDNAPIDEWLPRIENTTNGTTRATTVDCSAISRPASYSGGNLLTILTFNLGANDLGDGQPTVLVADGDMVYSNGPSLYVAGNQWQQAKRVATGHTPAQVTTEIYRFDTPDNQRPTFAAGGGVPGSLLSQYALSEFDGKLRVATTSQARQGAPSASGVYVLAQEGRTLKQVGAVEGLGSDEQIYAVRFLGPVGYVVTFRQTDPLYTVDLSDPAKPTVRGELKIPGYSAYLHPADGNRLIGIGRNANDQGRVKGTQVSLFDVSNLSEPTRVAQYTLSGAYSEAEFDPHAFLFWPATGLLVVPLQTRYLGDPAANTKVRPSSGALVLRVSGKDITEVGFIQHPEEMIQVRRSLVIGKTLWTVSDAGLLASDLTSLTRQAWIALH